MSRRKTRRLKVGDVVVVSTVLTGLSEYPVLDIVKGKAITKFRDFNSRIYEGDHVFEFGRSPHQTTNSYWVKSN